MPQRKKHRLRNRNFAPQNQLLDFVAGSENSYNQILHNYSCLWSTQIINRSLGDRAMKFKRVEHVAIAVKNMEKMRDVFENKLGIKMEYEEELPHYSTKLAMYPIGETYLEVLESSSPTTETSKWIEEHGEGLFHICLEVEDIDSALIELKEKGVKLLDQTPRIGHGGARIAFLNPESTGNLLIELAEIPEEVSH